MPTLNLNTQTPFFGPVIIGDTVQYPGASPDCPPFLTEVPIAGVMTPIKAVVEFQSVLGTMVIPRMTNAQEAALGVAATNANGGMWYNTDLQQFRMRQNNANISIGAAAGEIIGPGVTVVNALARWNNVAGTALSNSTVLLDNVGNLTAVNTIQNALGTALLPSYTFTGEVTTGMWSAGATTVNFSTTNGQQFSILDGGALTVNQVQVSGSPTGSAVAVSAIGGDANVVLNVLSKGASSVQIGSAANGIGFVVNGPAPATVNYLRASGSISGAPIGLTAVGGDANVNMFLTAAGTGTINLGNGNGQALVVSPGGAAVANSIEIDGGPAGASAKIRGVGQANTGIEISSSGTGSVYLSNNGNFGLGANFSVADTNTLLVTAGTAPIAGIAGAIKLYAAAPALPAGSQSIGIFAGTSPISAVAPTAPNRTLAVVVNGVTYYIACKTSND